MIFLVLSETVGKEGKVIESVDSIFVVRVAIELE